MPTKISIQYPLTPRVNAELTISLDGDRLDQEAAVRELDNALSLLNPPPPSSSPSPSTESEPPKDPPPATSVPVSKEPVVLGEISPDGVHAPASVIGQMDVIFAMPGGLAALMVPHAEVEGEGDRWLKVKNAEDLRLHWDSSRQKIDAASVGSRKVPLSLICSLTPSRMLSALLEDPMTDFYVDSDADNGLQWVQSKMKSAAQFCVEHRNSLPALIARKMAPDRIMERFNRVIALTTGCLCVERGPEND